METAQITKLDSKENNTKKEGSRRSENPGKSSENLRGESNGKRAHASEAFQAVGALSTTAENSEAVIASLEKHRQPKSGSKSKGKNSSKNKADLSKAKKNLIEAKTISDGQKWVSSQDKVEGVSVNEGENKSNNKNTRSKVKIQQKSKSKGKAGREVSSENGKSKPKTPGKATEKDHATNTKSVIKSVTKSVGKSKEKSREKTNSKKSHPDSLKRTRIDTDLTNDEPASGIEEVKSVKKSVDKSTAKSKQSK